MGSKEKLILSLALIGAMLSACKEEDISKFLLPGGGSVPEVIAAALMPSGSPDRGQSDSRESMGLSRGADRSPNGRYRL